MEKILITGAASGIGRACADHFAARGARLVLVDRDGEGFSDLEREHDTHVADVSDPAFWDAIPLDGLTGAIVNAGIGTAAPIEDLDFAEWRQVMSVNLDGAFLTLQRAIRAMKDGGAITVTASATGLKPVPNTAAYGCSKAALIHLARIAASEVAGRRIRVNAIAPGGVDTAIWDDGALDPLIEQHGSREAAITAMGLAVPLGRFAQPEEIAAQIAFLMSRDAGTITGSVLTSDGGFTL
ncbi:SDR family NAD(P)-dependent oxidoreductase [Sphingomicrobium nitratireducens]|uniref:SDR family NAD(P)-dependent oxidoreductase n=1 Tax=Sphingomicrobium nitratireducens TaxID=2964666 RepID=UPI00223EEBBB|nr:SDR family oxidoreductase [Sphingomicrobium nitratireducens]